MDWINEHYQLILLAGVVIIALTMFRQMVQRMRKNFEKEMRRENAVQAAQDAEREQQRASVISKAKASVPKTRAPLGEPFGTPFTGVAQGIAARWETEVHQIGRQIIGQIDCKMAALQAITQDANRTAIRLELLVEHLEQIAQKQAEWQKQIASDDSDVSTDVVSVTEPVFAAVPLTDVLKELTEDLKGIRSTTQQNLTFGKQAKPIAVLRLPEQHAETSTSEVPDNFRGEVEMLSNYGLAPQEIARRLNISLGEVDLVLQVQQNRLGHTDSGIDTATL